MASDSFDLGVDLDVYRLENVDQPRPAVFFARPDTPPEGPSSDDDARRFSRNPEIEIHVIGQELHWHRPTFAFVSHGHIPGPELAALYNRCVAGLVLSLTCRCCRPNCSPPAASP
jgi:hypothetical protein